MIHLLNSALNNLHWIILAIALLFFLIKLIKKFIKERKVAKLAATTAVAAAATAANAITANNTTNNGNVTGPQNTPATPPKKEKFWDFFGKIMAIISVVGTILFITWLVVYIYSFFSSKEKESNNIQQLYSFPISGNEKINPQNPAKAYLDPSKTYTWSKEKTGFKIVFEKNKEIQLEITEKPENNKQQMKWSEMPPGNYLVYPIGNTSISFQWWQ